MMVKMEVFSGGPYCAGCVSVLELADEFAEKYKGRLAIVKFIGDEATSRFDEYKLGCVPAVVINKNIRIEGICPSRVTLERALREAGLWTE
jgi:thiol-disulfide isomerase/thioredoxin